MSVPEVLAGERRFFVGVGDVLDVLRTIPDGSVHCCVTSPPYWGLRDYGTAEWGGGDPACTHERQSAVSRASSGLEGATATQGGAAAYGKTCGKCGATRVDNQIGLEPTPACGNLGRFRLKAGLTEAQREYVVRRLLDGERRGA